MKIINNFPKLTKLDNIENELTDKAPIDHSSTTTNYGAGSVTNYGHVKLSDSYTTSDGAAASGIGASSAAVYNAYNTLNSNLEWKFVGSQKGTATSITLPSNWKELIVIANANNSTAALGTWYFIRKILSTTACRFTQGTGTSWISIWASLNWVNIYQGVINEADVTSTSTIAVYYR